MNLSLRATLLALLLCVGLPAVAPGQQAPSKKDDLSDLPLVEVPATGPANDVLAVFISGDGGWARLVGQTSRRMAAQGVSVVGWNARQYFSKERTPEQIARDVERVLRRYLAVWKKERVMLVGYSFGADVLPFVVNRLPADLSAKVTLVALLGLGHTASFAFHVLSWLGKSYPETERPVMPELVQMKGRRIVCLCGEDEADSLCKKLPAGLAEVERFAGGHHFDGDYDALADAVLKYLP